MQVVDESLTLIDSQNLSDNSPSKQSYFISLSFSEENGTTLNRSEAEIEKIFPNPKTYLGNLVKGIPFYDFDNIK